MYILSVGFLFSTAHTGEAFSTMCQYHIYTTRLRHYRDGTLEVQMVPGNTLLVIPTVATGSSKHGDILAAMAQPGLSIPVPPNTFAKLL